MTDQFQYATHTLANGLTILITSPHLPREGDPDPLRFSDGTEFAPSRETAQKIKDEIAKNLTISGLREDAGGEIVREENGIRFERVKLSLPDSTVQFLKSLQSAADLVLVGAVVIQAIRESGLADQFPKVVAQFATAETARNVPSEKVIDVTRWSVA